MPIPVSLGKRSYSIVLANSYQRLPQHISALGLSKHGWIVSHPRLLSQYGRSLLSVLQKADWSVQTLTIPESESSKSLAIVQRLIERLSHGAAMHIPVLFALGGGVVGDVSGFAAAVFRRGIPYVQLPTTLLAQVDSAIGGKVGVDIPHAKNMVGAFYQPRLVYNNLSVLESLPLRQRKSGLAEIIKYGMIADAQLFTFLEQRLEKCLTLHPRATRFIVERSCAIKAQIVSSDECEIGGLRAHLNFGHTLGHALEAATTYRRWTHGEAIAIGMCAAAHLSFEMGLLAAMDFQRLVRLIQRSCLPSKAQGVSLKKVLHALRYDKKFIHGRSRWVLPIRIGRVIVTEDVPIGIVKKVLARYVG